MASDISKNYLVPKHAKLSDVEKGKLLESFSISTKELPKITKSDAAIAKLNAKEGDVIKIERESKTAGKALYYRVVVDG